MKRSEEKDIYNELERLISKAHILTVRAKDQKEQLEVERKEISQDITRWMNKLGITEYSFVADQKFSGFYKGFKKLLTCKKVEPKSISYDAEKIAKRIGKQNASAVVSKSYRVNDMKGLIRLLKIYGVDPKKFKKFIDVDYTLNTDRLEQLYQTGVVSIEDLQGCYEVKSKTPYWSVKAKEAD